MSEPILSESPQVPESPQSPQEMKDSYRTYTRVLLAILVVLILGVVYHMMYQMPALERQTRNRLNLRELCTLYVVYTHMFINSNMNDSPNLKNVADRLYQSQADFAAYLVKHFGPDAAVIHDFLNKNVDQLSVIISFLKNGGKRDSEEFMHMYNVWQQNSQEIAMILSGLYKLPVEELQNMSNKKLNLTLEEISASLSDPETAQVAFDQAYLHAMTMADYLAMSPMI